MSAAFLADFPELGSLSLNEILKKESKYASIEKVVETKCKQEFECDNPNPTLDFTYTVTITPKEDYAITITSFEDVLGTTFNLVKYKDEGKPVPSKPDETLSLSQVLISGDFSEFTQGMTIFPGQTLILTYRRQFDQSYSDASVLNKATVKFAYQNLHTSGTDEMMDGKNVGIGDFPKGRGCWPTTGTIVQLPHSSFSHGSADAYDISSNAGTEVYAPYPGELCAIKCMDTGYGCYYVLKTTIEGKDEALLFAHFHSLNFSGCKNVNEGDYIGPVGTRGYSEGPHLHYEAATDGVFYASPGKQSLLRRIVPKDKDTGQEVGLEYKITDRCEGLD